MDTNIIHENQNEIQLYKLQNGRLIEKLEALTFKFSTSQNKIKELEKQLVKYSHLNSFISGRNAKKIWQLISETEIESELIDVEMIEHQQRNTNNKMNYQCKDCQKNKSKIQKLTNKLDHFQYNLQRQQINKRQKESETMSVLEKCEVGRDEIIKKVTELQKSADDIKNIAETNTQLKDLVEEKDQLIADEKNKVELLEKQIEEFKTTISDLTSTNVNFKSELNKLKEDKRISKLNTEELIKIAVNERTLKLDEATDKYVHEIEELKKYNEKMFSDNQNLTHSIQQSNIRISELQLQVAQYESSKVDSIELDEQLQNAQERLEMRARQIGELTSEVTRRTEVEKQLNGRMEKLQNDMNEMKEKINSNINENEVLTEQLGQYEVLLQQELHQKVSLNKEISCFEEKCRKLEVALQDEKLNNEEILTTKTNEHEKEKLNIQKQIESETHIHKETKENLLNEIRNLKELIEQLYAEIACHKEMEHKYQDELQVKSETLNQEILNKDKIKKKYKQSVESHHKKFSHIEKEYKEDLSKQRDRVKSLESKLEKQIEMVQKLKKDQEKEIDSKCNQETQKREEIEKHFTNLLEASKCKLALMETMHEELLKTEEERRNKLVEEMSKLQSQYDLLNVDYEKIIESNDESLLNHKQEMAELQMNQEDILKKEKILTNNLKEENEKLTKYLTQFQTSKDELEEKLKLQIKSMEEFKENEINNLKESNKRECDRLDMSWSHKLSEVTNERQVLRESVLRLQLEAISRSREVDRLEQECRTRTEALDDRVTKLNELEKQIEEILQETDEKINKEKEAQVDLQKVIDTKSKQLEESNRKIKEIHQTMQDSKKETHNNKAQITELKSELIEKKEIIKELLNRISERELRLEKQESDRDILLAKSSELKRVSKQLLELRTTSAEQEIRLKKEISNLNIQLDKERKKSKKLLLDQQEKSREDILELNQRLALFETRVFESEHRAKERAEEILKIRSKLVENESIIEELGREMRLRGALVMKLLNKDTNTPGNMATGFTTVTDVSQFSCEFNSSNQALVIVENEDSKITELSRDEYIYEDLSLNQLLDRLSSKYPLDGSNLPMK